MFKHKVHSGVFFGLLLTASFSAFGASAEEGEGITSFFIGGNVGYQLADDDNYEYSDPGAAVFGVSSGVHFNDFWRWDLGVQFSQSLEAPKNGITVKPQWWETALRYDWELPSDYSVYSRIGIAYWDMNKDIKGRESLSARGVSPLIEAGVSYSISPRLSVDGGLKYIDQIGDKLTGQYDSASINLSLNYSFASSKQAEILQDENTEVEVVEPLPPVTIIETVNGSSYSLPFKFASSEVDTNNSQLMEVLDVLLEYPSSKVVLIGHTDSVGSSEANFFLSKKRANNVASYLNSKGIEQSRIEVKGVGENDPIASNATAEGRQKNIRVEMVIPEFSYKVLSETENVQVVN